MQSKISFIKDCTFIIEPKFHEIYTLDKEHKMQNKKLFNDKTNERGVCLYADIFSRENIFSSVMTYWYRTKFIDEITFIRFAIIIMSKNTIYKKNWIVFNKI